MAVYRTVQVNFWQDDFVFGFDAGGAVFLCIFVDLFEDDAVWDFSFSEAIS